MAKKNITTNDLALMIGKGFAGVDENFKKVNQRLDGVETRLGKVESRLGKVEYLLSTDYKKRLEKAEEDIKELKGLLAV